jgi:ferredoxin-nitrite reductase
VVGGGFAENPKIGTEIWKAVKTEDAPCRVEALLKTYLALREGKDESFQAFTARKGPEALRDAAEEQPVLKAAA